MEALVLATPELARMFLEEHSKNAALQLGIKVETMNAIAKDPLECLDFDVNNDDFADCLTGLLSATSPPTYQVATELYKKIFNFITTLCSHSPDVKRFVQTHPHVLPNLLFHIDSFEHKSEVTTEAFNLLEVLTYDSDAVTWSGEDLIEFPAFLSRRIQDATTSDAVLKSCIGILRNLCWRNTDFRISVKREHDYRALCKRLADLVSSAQTGIVIGILSVFSCLDPLLRKKVFEPGNVHQTFLCICNILIRGSQYFARHYAVDLMLDGLKSPELPELLLKFQHFEPSLSQIAALLLDLKPLDLELLKIYELLNFLMASKEFGAHCSAALTRNSGRNSMYGTNAPPLTAVLAHAKHDLSALPQLPGLVFKLLASFAKRDDHLVKHRETFRSEAQRWFESNRVLEISKFDAPAYYFAFIQALIGQGIFTSEQVAREFDHQRFDEIIKTLSAGYTASRTPLDKKLAVSHVLMRCFILVNGIAQVSEPHKGLLSRRSMPAIRSAVLQILLQPVNRDAVCSALEFCGTLNHSNGLLAQIAEDYQTELKSKLQNNKVNHTGCGFASGQMFPHRSSFSGEPVVTNGVAALPAHNGDGRMPVLSPQQDESLDGLIQRFKQALTVRDPKISDLLNIYDTKIISMKNFQKSSVALVNAQKGHLSTANNCITQMRHMISEMEKETTALRGIVEESTDSAVAFQNKIRELENGLNTCRAERDEEKRRAESLAAEYEKNCEKLQENLQDYEEQIKELKKESRRLGKSLQDEKSKNEQLEEVQTIISNLTNKQSEQRGRKQ